MVKKNTSTVVELLEKEAIIASFRKGSQKGKKLGGEFECSEC